ncbi:MAG: Holliday junction resolvase RuvX [Actinomycetota bacterium]|nr:Holliday junction resolvase RuvX [Actinomycetota bacterium]
MTVLGIDPGERRVGVAAADLETRFARPVEVIDVSRVDPVSRIDALVRELDVTCVVVGKPVGLSGREGAAVERQRTLVDALRSRLDVDVTEYDERLTTVVAENAMRAGGTRSKQRKAKRDAVAAQVMLQGYMDATR